ncbi:hypothetical protein DFH28DRAFT_1160034 [Melampsora americana]|nr:hypothetical protein DFH28DRAFT_1160034 [Melampsora americana]
MNKGNAPPPARSNGPPGLVWRTYSQRARALNIPLRPTKATQSLDLVSPSGAVPPLAPLSLNRLPSPIIRPDPRYVSNSNPATPHAKASQPAYLAGLQLGPLGSPVASKGDFIVPVSSKTNGYDVTPTKPQGKILNDIGLPHQASGTLKTKIHINLAASSEPEGLDATPTKDLVLPHRPAAIPNKKNEIDLAGTSKPKPAQATQEGGTHPSGVARMRQLTVAYTLFLQKGPEPPKGSAKTKKPSYTTVPLTSTQTPFDTNCVTIATLKNRLFLIASEIDPTNDESKGNEAILKGANARNLVKILGIVKGHDRFGKGKFTAIKTDADVVQFFNAVRNCPQKDSGFTVTMENPQKAAQEAEEAILKKKARLRAQNEMDNVPTTAVDIARCVPEDQEDLHLKVLQLHHGSMKTGNNEGYRLFNRKDHSLKMDIGFRQMLIWAKYLAKGVEGVTIEIPPADHPEFIWKDINSK